MGLISLDEFSIRQTAWPNEDEPWLTQVYSRRKGGPKNLRYYLFQAYSYIQEYDKLTAKWTTLARLPSGYWLRGKPRSMPLEDVHLGLPPSAVHRALTPLALHQIKHHTGGMFDWVCSPP